MCKRSAYHAKWGRHHRHGHGYPAKKFMARKFAQAMGQPPVNVEEQDDRYELFVYAAGYKKEDFQIHLKDNNLIVEGKQQERGEENRPNWKRREFRPVGFERWFELNEKIDKDAIKAKYENGVLQVTLPKLEGAATYRQDIVVD